jgi:hypothetical protein
MGELAMTETLTHAVTRPQPEAWALASGHCPVINSDTRPGLEHVGKLIGIHAAQRQKPTPEIILRAQVKIAMGDPHAQPVKFTYGALVGVARLVGVVRRLGKFYDRDDGGPSFGRCIGKGAVMELLSQAESKRIEPWWRGPWGWLLEDAVALPEPIPMRGAGGLWRIPATDAGHGLMLAHEWALEQWRKGRAER